MPPTCTSPAPAHTRRRPRNCACCLTLRDAGRSWPASIREKISCEALTPALRTAPSPASPQARGPEMASGDGMPTQSEGSRQIKIDSCRPFASLEMNQVLQHRNRRRDQTVVEQSVPHITVQKHEIAGGLVREDDGHKIDPNTKGQVARRRNQSLGLLVLPIPPPRAIPTGHRTGRSDDAPFVLRLHRNILIPPYSRAARRIY